MSRRDIAALAFKPAGICCALAVWVITLTGCVVPLAVFPCPIDSSGKTMTYATAAGERITKDGLAVVTFRYDSCHAFCRERPSRSEVVEIKKGVVRVPLRWELGSLWLGCWKECYLIGCPLVKTAVYAFIPGFNPGYGHTLYPFAPVGASGDMQFDLSSFYCREMGRGSTSPSDIDLSRADYLRLREFVGAESRRLAASHPASGPADRPH